MPEYWEPVYAISNEPRISGRTTWAIASAFTNNRPFGVFGKGLAKALRAEMATGAAWIKRRL